MLKALILAAFFLAALGSGAYAEQPQKRACAAQGSQGSTAPIAPKHQISKSNECKQVTDGQQSQSPKPEKSSWDSFRGWLGETSTTNTFLVLFTGLLFVTQAIQGAANWIAANAAKRSADVLVATERARLFEKGIAITSPAINAPPTEAKASLWIKNSGNTPAIIISRLLYIWVGDSPPTGCEFGAEPVSIPLSAKVKFKFSHGWIGHNQTTMPEAMEKLASGVIQFYLFGEFIYLDAIGKRRVSRFTYALGSQLTNRDKFPSPPHTEYT